MILEPGLTFFLVGVVYVISGPAGYVWRWRTGRELLPAEDTGPLGSAPVRTEDKNPTKPTEDGDVAPNVTSLVDHVQSGDSRGGETGR